MHEHGPDPFDSETTMGFVVVRMGDEDEDTSVDLVWPYTRPRLDDDEPSPIMPQPSDLED